MDISVDSHPLLEPVLLLTRWPAPLGTLNTIADLEHWFSERAAPPIDRPDEVKGAVRSLLRHGGFKPSGRSKPASEYLVKAAEAGILSNINPAVDCCNVASLWSGLPISVVDVDRGSAPWSIRLADEGASYVFNPSGQEISIGGLISLVDASGPCGGPVKDSQRTKTHEGTTCTISVIWGTTALPGRAEATADWYSELMSSLGAVVERVRPAVP